MNHMQIKNKLSVYIDGECSLEMKDSIKKHLNACQDCAQELTELQNVKQLLSNLQDIEPSSDYFDCFQKKLDAECMDTTVSVQKKKTVSFKRYLVPSFSVAAAAAALIFLSMLFLSDVPKERLPVPMVTYTYGKVLVDEPDSSETDIAFVKKAVIPGQVIETNQFARVDLECGSLCRIRLGENTRVKIKEFNIIEGKLVFSGDLLDGTMLAYVKKNIDNPVQFIVNTDIVEVSVVGTKFMVETSTEQGNNAVQVAVLKGTVSALPHSGDDTDSQKDAYYIHANQKMTFRPNGNVHLERELSTADFERLYEVYSIGSENDAAGHERMRSQPFNAVHSTSR